MSCEHCTRVAGTGEGRILVALTVSELIDLACATGDPLRERLLVAAALLDPESVRAAREDLRQ